MPAFVQSSSNRTIVRDQIAVDSAGNLQAVLVVKDSAGIILETRNVRVPADGSAITDQYGGQIAATVPGALSTAITSFVAALDSAIASAAAGGRFNR